MTKIQKRNKGITQAAWGCVFLYLDLNINSLNLLPNFAGYLLFLLAIQNLAEEDRDFALLTPLGVLLTGWDLAMWILRLFGFSTEIIPSVLGTLASVISLYFCFQLYTDFAKLAVRYQRDGERIDAGILHCRTILTVSCTILSLPFPTDAAFGWIAIILFLVTLVSVCAALYLTMQLFRLRRVMQACEEE